MVWNGDANGGKLGGDVSVDGNRVGRVVKTKIIVELSNYFFSRPVSSQPKYIKHSIAALHQLLPHRILGPGVGWADSPMHCHCKSAMVVLLSNVNPYYSYVNKLRIQ